MTTPAAAASSAAANLTVSTSVPPFSVSGQSSGGSMAMQFLFSFSSAAQGAAVAGGSLYGCGDQLLPQQTCYGFLPANVEAANAYARRQHSEGLIDAPSNLLGVPMLLFNGKQDSVVYTAAMRDAKRQLEHFAGASSVTANFQTNAGHVWAVDHGNCPCGACSSGGGTPATTYSYASYSYGGYLPGDECCDVNDCEYDLSGEALRRALGASLRPRTTARQPLSWVRQSTYFAARGGRKQTLMHWAILYVPRQCEADVSRCSVHVNFHGCMQTSWKPRRDWVRRLDLNEYAEANDVIVVYPQAKGNADGQGVGCWNWYDYTVDKWFDTQYGYELGTVANLLNDLQRAVSGATKVARNDGAPTRTGRGRTGYLLP